MNPTKAKNSAVSSNSSPLKIVGHPVDMNMPINNIFLQRFLLVYSVGAIVKKPYAIGKRYLFILYHLKLILGRVRLYVSL